MKLYIAKSYKNTLGRGIIIYCKFCSSFVIRRLS
nr:MAG TPA: hypothetical protein [Inoviridae sp.]